MASWNKIAGFVTFRHVSALSVQETFVNTIRTKQNELDLQDNFLLTKYGLYKVLNDIWFEEDLKYMYGAPDRLPFQLDSGIHGLFKDLGRHANRNESHECPTWGNPKESVEPIVSHNPKKNFLNT